MCLDSLPDPSVASAIGALALAGRLIPAALGVPLLIMLTAQTIYLLILLIRPLAAAAPWAALITDGGIALAFALIAAGEPLMSAAAAIAIALGGLMRASWAWSAGQVALAIATVIGGVLLTSGQPGIAAFTQAGALPLIAGGLLLVIPIVAYALEHTVGLLGQQVAVLSRARTADQAAVRERTRAIYELAYSMSDSIRYERILEAALEAGTIGVKAGEQVGPGLTAAVMLYHADDNLLHVVANRRLSKADIDQVIPGRAGIIAQALKDVEPIIGGSARRDPELQFFSAFQFCRSVLVIPLHSGYDNFGVIVYGSERPDVFTAENRDVLTAVGLLATVGLQNALLYQALREEKERLVEVEEDARKKLARALHDGPTQSVSAIAMRMNYINRLISKAPDKVPEELHKVEEIARKTTREIRHMLFTLRPLVLETQGLNVALQQLAEKIEETHGQRVTTRMTKEVEAVLDRNQQGVIFYIVEEAINNARKHAQAALIQVAISRQDDVVVIKVADNGRGFDPQAVSTNYDQRGSLGMINMRERAEMIEGRLSVESVPGRGTVITVVVPLRKGAALPTEPVSGRVGTTKIALAAAERMQQRRDPPR